MDEHIVENFSKVRLTEIWNSLEKNCMPNLLEWRGAGPSAWLGGWLYIAVAMEVIGKPELNDLDKQYSVCVLTWLDSIWGLTFKWKL